MMADKNFSSFCKLLSGASNKLTAIKNTTDASLLLKELYQIIKKCNFQVQNPTCLNKNEQNIIYFTLSSLVDILISDTFLADVLLLCGTCICSLIVTLFKEEFSVTTLVHLYYHFDKNYSGISKPSNTVIEASKKELSTTLETLFYDSETCIPTFFKLHAKYFLDIQNSEITFPSFQQIAVLNGIVSCQKPHLLMYELRHCHTKFLVFVFSMIHQCCLSPSIHQYHAFNVLISWVRICNCSLPACFQGEDLYFQVDGTIVHKILSLLESNWQSPIKGVNSFVKEMYKLLISLSKQESKKVGIDDMKLVDYLMKKSLMFGWQNKGKYLILSAVLQHTSYSKFFKENPEAPLNIISNLRANYIASSVTEVYKVVVMNMKNSNSEEDFYSEWCNWFRKPITECLNSTDKLLIQNVMNNVLPWTMKTFSKSYDLMMAAENLNDSVKLLLLRVAKETFCSVLGKKELNLIHKNLHHCNIQIRSEILSILCSSPKKSEPTKPKELDLLKKYLLENFNIDSASFHQHLLSQLRILLSRIRDSLAQEYHSSICNKENSIGLPQLENDTVEHSLTKFVMDILYHPRKITWQILKYHLTLEKLLNCKNHEKTYSLLIAIEFVEWLFQTAVKNTFPGACYQRRRVALYILNDIFDVFIQSPKGLSRKEKPSKSVKYVIEWAQQKNMWHFFKNNCLLNILPCITDFTDEIRVLAANLLLHYSPWPQFVDCSDLNEDKVLKYALSLCNHPDYRNNDSGSHICHIIFMRLCGDYQEENFKSCSKFLKYLIYLSQLQLASAKEDILTAAVETPIHGMLLSLQYCFSHSKDFMKTFYQFCPTETMEILKESVDLCFETIQLMSKTLKGDDNEDDFNCPSFMDIGKALKKLVISNRTNLINTGVEQSGEEFTETVNCEDSFLLDLLLSCCWHSIKNSCFLLSELSDLISSYNIDYAQKRKMLGEICGELSLILKTCRHRGVVEACSEALHKFCKYIVKDKIIYEDVTMSLLKSVFESLEDSAMISVTRRSAGLPLLFIAVVSSEDNNLHKNLLSYTVENLLNLISKPLPSAEDFSEKTDLPQAHSYHILKALILDSRLSQNILPYFDAIIPACVTGFSSHIWAIRNGALQLFGVILPRVCGQKKVQDDESEHNMVSAFELFARCPGLKAYLLKELEKCVLFHYKKSVCSELVPILSLLVKLLPEHQEQRDLLKDFIPLLLSFLDIPVWKVRDLVSSALSTLMNSDCIVNLLEDLIHDIQNLNENLNKHHSILFITQKYLKQNYNKDIQNCNRMEKCLKYIYCSIEKDEKCLFLSGIIIDIFLLMLKAKNNISAPHFLNEFEVLKTCSNYQAGFEFFESKAVLVQIKFCPLSDIPLLLQNLSSKNKNVQIVCLKFLSQKLLSEQTSKSFHTESNFRCWENIFRSVTDYICPERHPNLMHEALAFMINICSMWSIGNFILNSCASTIGENLQCLLPLESGLSVAALSFTMWSMCIKASLTESSQSCVSSLILEKWTSLFNSYSLPRSNDILRMQAARSVAIVGQSLSKYLEGEIGAGKENAVHMFINLHEGSLHLLQDEDPDIRNEACKFPSQVQQDYNVDILQFNTGIKVIFQNMERVLSRLPFFLIYLWNRLQNYPSSIKIFYSCCKIKKINLFEQEYINVFAEPHQILMHYHQTLKNVLAEWKKQDYEFFIERIEIFLHDLRSDLQDVHSVLSLLNSKALYQSYSYHHLAFLALKKLKCQTEILLQQNCAFNFGCSLTNELDQLKVEWHNIENLLPSVTCWFLS